MPDPKPSDEKIPVGNVTPTAPASTPAATPEPAKTEVQPAPGASTPVEPPKTDGDKLDPQTVPVGALLEERNKRQALEAEMALLRQPPQQPQYPQQPQQQPNVRAEEIEKLWDTDPRKAVQAEMMMAMEWFDRTNNSIDQQADTLAGKYTDFSQWRSQASRYVRALPLQQRAQPGVLEMAYFIVRGQNVDGMLKQQNEDMIKKFQTGELAGQVSTPAGMVSAPASTPGVALTDDQRNAAAAMGVSEEEYAKYVTPGGVK